MADDGRKRGEGMRSRTLKSAQHSGMDAVDQSVFKVCADTRACCEETEWERRTLGGPRCEAKRSDRRWARVRPRGAT